MSDTNKAISSSISHPVILYDGVCGLCNRLNQFVLKRDRNGVFRFASLQSKLAADVLGRHGKDPHDLDTLYLILNHGQPNESLLCRSDATIFILQELGGVWGAASSFARVLPPSLRDAAYNLIARNRYKIFGRYDTCMLPSPDTRNRFLDV